MKKPFILNTLGTALLGALVFGGLGGCSGGGESENGSQSASTPTAYESTKEAPKDAEKVSSQPVTPLQKQVSQQSTADVKQPVAEMTAPDVKKGESLYATCVGCHGASGEGGVGPKLRGQSKASLISKMKGYRDGKQYGSMTSMMAPNVQGFSDKDIEKVAEYIANM